MSLASPQARDPLINWHFGAFVECFDVKSMLTKTHCAAKLLGCQTQTRSMGFQPSSVRKVYTAFNPWLFDAICNSHRGFFLSPLLAFAFQSQQGVKNPTWNQTEVALWNPKLVPGSAPFSRFNPPMFGFNSLGSGLWQKQYQTLESPWNHVKWTVVYDDYAGNTHLR